MRPELFSLGKLTLSEKCKNIIRSMLMSEFKYLSSLFIWRISKLFFIIAGVDRQTSASMLLTLTFTEEENIMYKMLRASFTPHWAKQCFILRIPQWINDKNMANICYSVSFGWHKRCYKVARHQFYHNWHS